MNPTDKDMERARDCITDLLDIDIAYNYSDKEDKKAIAIIAQAIVDERERCAVAAEKWSLEYRNENGIAKTIRGTSP